MCFQEGQPGFGAPVATRPYHVDRRRVGNQNRSKGAIRLNFQASTTDGEVEGIQFIGCMTRRFR